MIRANLAGLLVAEEGEVGEVEHHPRHLLLKDPCVEDEQLLQQLAARMTGLGVWDCNRKRVRSSWLMGQNKKIRVLRSRSSFFCWSREF